MNVASSALSRATYDDRLTLTETGRHFRGSKTASEKLNEEIRRSLMMLLHVAATTLLLDKIFLFCNLHKVFVVTALSKRYFFVCLAIYVTLACKKLACCENRLRFTYSNVCDIINEKALRETQTLCAGCSKAETKIFAPPQTPFPGRRTAKIQSAEDGHYRPSLVNIDARNFELSW